MSLRNFDTYLSWPRLLEHGEYINKVKQKTEPAHLRVQFRSSRRAKGGVWTRIDMNLQVINYQMSHGTEEVMTYWFRIVFWIIRIHAYKLF